MPLTCQCCGGEVDALSLHAKFSPLFERFALDNDFIPSDLEEAVYFYNYCSDCCGKLLVDEGEY
jgi:hypothetical protein